MSVERVRGSFLLIGLALAGASGRAGAENPDHLSRRIVDYRIEARLDPGRKLVAGTEVVTYHNGSADTLREISFHLYPNAFANDRTLAARETFREEGPHPQWAAATRAGGWGWMSVGSVALADGTDLSTSTTVEETLMRVRLPEPVPPGESVSLRIAWETKLPLVINRMGYWGEHFDVMQWFPKPGVYQDGAWNAHPFHAHSEFFADFGTFDVTLTVPARFQVEATGTLTSEKLNGDGTRSFTYHAEDVHDFAWVADPNARIAREKYRGIEIVFFHQPGQAVMVHRILATARVCIDRYGRWYFPYPYPRIVMIGLPMGLGGGMEYPMLFTTSMAWFLPGIYVGPESVTAHEFGHQYFYGILASNEFEEAWLDEGINTYSTLRLLDATIIHRRGGSTLDAISWFAAFRALDKGIPLELGFRTFNLNQLIGFTRSPFRQSRPTLLGYSLSPFNLNLPGLTDGIWLARKDAYVREGREDSMETFSWDFYPDAYSPTVYSKTATVLRTLERILGPDKMSRVLKEYAAREKFHHPRAADFLAVASEVASTDLQAFADQMIFGTATVDFAVGPVTSEAVRPPIGFLPPEGVGRPVRESKEKGPPGGEYLTEAVVRQRGDAALPVDVLFTFEDGTSVRERWDATGGGWRRYSYLRRSRLRSLIIDPDRVYAVDVNFNNNSHTRRRQEAAVEKISIIWLFWIQNFLHLVSTMG